MKKKLKRFFIIYTSAYLLTAFVSCKKESNNNSSTSNKIDKSLIYGWWYNDPARSQIAEYKGRNFKNDGTMIADATNYGLGIGNYGGGTWYWSADTIIMIGAGSLKAFVKKITTDSLYYDLIDYAGAGTVAKMYYHR